MTEALESAQTPPTAEIALAPAPKPKAKRTRGKKKFGRPFIKLNRDTIVKLIAKGATVQYVATFCGVSHHTITRNYSEAVEAGIQLRNGSLQMRQFKSAQSGNPNMLKWLGQQWLGQKEKTEVASTTLLADWTEAMRDQYVRDSQGSDKNLDAVDSEIVQTDKPTDSENAEINSSDADQLRASS